MNLNEAKQLLKKHGYICKKPVNESLWGIQLGAAYKLFNDAVNNNAFKDFYFSAVPSEEFNNLTLVKNEDLPEGVAEVRNAFVQGALGLKFSDERFYNYALTVAQDIDANEDGPEHEQEFIDSLMTEFKQAYDLGKKMMDDFK